jgi:hypothetical protein
LLRTSAQLAELVEVSPEVLAQLRRLAARPALSAPRLVALIRLFAPGPPSRGGVRPQLPLELNLVEAAQLLQSATAGPPAAVEPAPGPTAVPSARPSPPPAPAASAPVVPGAPVARGPAPPLAPVIAPAPSEPVPPSEVGRTSGILFEDAQRRWNEVLEACGSRNRSVQALLRAARPVELENQTLVLGFTYEFHRERIEDVKNRVVVEDTIERVLGRRFAVRCVLANKEAMKETTPAADAVQSAMEDPVVRAAISLGARVRSVTDDNTEEKR